MHMRAKCGLKRACKPLCRAAQRKVAYVNHAGPRKSQSSKCIAADTGKAAGEKSRATGQRHVALDLPHTASDRYSMIQLRLLCVHVVWFRSHNSLANEHADRLDEAVTLVVRKISKAFPTECSGRISEGSLLLPSHVKEGCSMLPVMHYKHDAPTIPALACIPLRFTLSYPQLRCVRCPETVPGHSPLFPL